MQLELSTIGYLHRNRLVQCSMTSAADLPEIMRQRDDFTLGALGRVVRQFPIRLTLRGSLRSRAAQPPIPPYADGARHSAAGSDQSHRLSNETQLMPILRHDAMFGAEAFNPDLCLPSISIVAVVGDHYAARTNIGPERLHDFICWL